jgi:hypothetical protein
MKSWLVILIQICFVSFAEAFPSILLSEEKDDAVISAEFIEIFEDSLQTYSIADISSPAFNNRFYVNKNRIANIKNSRVWYWIRIRLKYPKTNDKRWLLEVLDLHVDRVQVYLKTDNDLIALSKTGYKLPFRQRDYLHKNFVFDIPQMPPNEEFSIYIRMQSETYNPFLFKLRTQNYFMYYALNEYYILGLYYGVLLIMAIYNMMLYFYVKERFYLYYVIYVLSCVLVSFSEDGLGFQYIWYDYPWFNKLVEDLGYFIFLFFFYLYAQAFLEFDKHLPTIRNVINWLLVVYGLFFIINIFINIYNPVYFSLLLIPFSLIYYASWQIYLKVDKKFSSFFLLGYSLTMIGILIAALRKNTVFAYDGILYVYGLNIGLMVEVIFFSLALAYRLRVIKLTNEASQLKLIQQLQENEKIILQKVNERTEKIAQQQQEIFEKNQELEAQAEQLRLQADEIRRMNIILDQENIALKSNVKELTKARVLMQEVSENDFNAIFSDEEACYKYLADLKWKNGYKCFRCKNEKFTSGQGHSARRCTKCGYNESSTVNTIFHRTHIPIKKAFKLMFLMLSPQGKMTMVELSNLVELRENTCAKFGKKIKDKMALIKSKADVKSQDVWEQLILE